MTNESARRQDTTAPGARVEDDRHFMRIGIRGLIVAVACCGVITWAGRSLWESQHPTIAAARGLGSREPSARARAVRELMTTGAAEPGLAIRPLLAALGDPAVEVRSTAAEALGIMGFEAAMAGTAGDVPRLAAAGLIRSLKDSEPPVRLGAAYALARIGTAGAPPGTIDLRAINQALAAALGDRDESARLAALEALGRCGPLASADPPGAILAAMRDQSGRVRAAAVKALAAFPCSLDPWLPDLLRSLEHDEPGIRMACWKAFARDKPPAFSAAAIPALVTALGSRSPIVRSRAAKALFPHAGNPRASAAIPSLVALLKEPSDFYPVDPESPPPPGEWSLGRGDVLAAELLGQLAPGKAEAGAVVAALAEALRSGNLSVRHPATEALGRFGAAAAPAVPALVRVLHEPLGRDDEANAYDGQSAAEALVKIAPGSPSAGEVVALLTEFLRSRHPSRRAWAADALAEFGPAAEPAVPALIQALAREDGGSRPGFSIPGALGRIAPGTRSADAALAALTEALQSPSEKRIGAIYALAPFGSKAAAAIPPLRAWQNGPDARLKTAASSALKAIEGPAAGRQGEDGNRTEEGQRHPECK